MRFLGIIFLTAVCAFAAFAQSGKIRAQNFSAVTLAGDDVELESLRGKIVLLTFWSTRCQICQAEIPQLNRLAAQYKGKDVVFLAPTMEKPERVEAFIEKNHFDFEILPDSFGLVLKYADKDAKGNINMGFPAYFLINRQGEIEAKSMGWDKIDSLNSQIARLLENK